MSQGTEARLEPQQQIPAAYLEPSLDQRVEETIDRAVQYLLSLQAPEGYWLGELEADSTLESDYIFYLHVLGKATRDRVAKLANHIRRKQLPDGAWNIYEGGPGELNATIKGYFALRLAEDAIDSPHLLRARRRVHELGGLERANSFTRLYLALCGIVGWEMVPAMPPECILLPSWFPGNIYSMSSWTRAIVVPLTILYALKPRWSFPQCTRLDELFHSPPGSTPTFAWDGRVFTWRNLFLVLDRISKLYERFPCKPLRKRALHGARRWLLEHLERSDGLGAIYPAMMNAVFALLALGYPPDDPLTAREIDHLANLEIEEDDTIQLQPCLSPVWDTGVNMLALEEAGLVPKHPALVKAARWLIERQVLGSGDWQIKDRDVEPGGWAFEFRNDFFPDVDDTAVVLTALLRVAYPDRSRMENVVRRGLAWVLSLQNRDGGWGAFDRDNDWAILTQVPFADHNAMIDPSTADVTARVVECLGRFGWPAEHPVIQRAVKFLLQDQSKDGSWFGRWGVNYIYGTSGVLRALETVSLTTREFCQRAVNWLRSVQKVDGSFGESLLSYDAPSTKGQGASTASQTAWGLIGLLAGAGTDDAAVTKAVAYLVHRQQADGSWSEPEFTGTGFPGVFYLKYHLYRNSFPVYALARYSNQSRKAEEYAAVKFQPSEFRLRSGI